MGSVPSAPFPLSDRNGVKLCIVAKLGVDPIPPFPKSPSVRIEVVRGGCYGEECNRAHSGIPTEELVELSPHFHLIETEPGTSGACYAVGGDLPSEDPYEFSHYY